MTDDGAPQLSWTTHIQNSGDISSDAYADADLEFLALEIRGNKEQDAAQSLVLGRGINLTGRNEIRIASNAILKVDGGTVSSLRWVDIDAGGGLNGNGRIDSSVYNSGAIAVTGSDNAALSVSGDFHQSQRGTLILYAGKRPAVHVDGTANINGHLVVRWGEDEQPKAGTTYTVLTADKVAGKFSYADSEAVDGRGRHFTIGYSGTAVTITMKQQF